MEAYPSLQGIINFPIKKHSLELVKLGQSFLEFVKNRIIYQSEEEEEKKKLAQLKVEYTLKRLNESKESKELLQHFGFFSSGSFFDKFDEISSELKNLFLESLSDILNKSNEEEDLLELEEGKMLKSEIGKSFDNFNEKSEETLSFKSISQIRKPEGEFPPQISFFEYFPKIKCYQSELNTLLQKKKYSIDPYIQNVVEQGYQVSTKLKVTFKEEEFFFNGKGIGRNKKNAKEEAAKQMLSKLYKELPFIMRQMNYLQNGVPN